MFIVLIGGLFSLIILFSSKKKLKDKAGKEGERIVSNKLSFWFGLGGSKIYNDLTFMTRSGKTTQIDHLVVSKKGIFCIETKNLNGVIKGNADDQYWKHTNNKGYKNDIYNPIFQNESHVNHVSALLGIDRSEITGFVTNVGKAKLKGNISPLLSSDLIESGTGFIVKLWFKPKTAFTAEEVQRFCEIIDKKTQDIDDEVRANHVKYVKSIKKKNGKSIYDYIYYFLMLILIGLIFVVVNSYILN